MGPTRRSLLLATAAVGLAPTMGFARAAERLPVVVSFSILSDFVREIAGDRADVVSLVGPDTDSHNFEPSPGEAAQVSRAKIVVVNGLGFDAWMSRLAKASGTKAAILQASRGVKTIAEKDHGHSHGHAHSHGADPHAFQDVRNAKIYVTNIRDALVAADPSGKATYEPNAARYLGELDALDSEVRSEIARIPPARRRVITDHDAFAYFAAAYGLVFVAPRGVGGESDVSARDVARIVRQIKAEKIPALFFENVGDPRLLEQIARESGAKIGGRLYSDALSRPDGPAPTYRALVRHNTKILVDALAQ